MVRWLGRRQSPIFYLESTMLRHFLRLSRLTLAVALPYVWLISIGTRTVRSGLRHQIDRKERRDLSIFQIGLRFNERCLTNDRLIRLPLCTSSEETVRWLAENRCLYFISRRGNLAGMNFTVQATAQCNLIHPAAPTPFFACIYSLIGPDRDLAAGLPAKWPSMAPRQETARPPPARIQPHSAKDETRRHS